MTKNLQIGKLCPEQAVLVALGAGDPTPRELTRSLVSLRFFPNSGWYPCVEKL